MIRMRDVCKRNEYISKCPKQNIKAGRRVRWKEYEEEPVLVLGSLVLQASDLGQIS